MKLIDHTGKTFGRLTVIGKAESRRTATQIKTMWNCVCSCGAELTVEGSTLKAQKSCNMCAKRLRAESKIKHGHAKHGEISRTWQIWSGMKNRTCKDRCHSSKKYRDYAARGITVCGRWMSFENFLSDMGECPDGMQIDRIDNDGNYEPSNCRWASLKDQANNKRGSRKITHNGITMTISQWAEKMNVFRYSLSRKIAKGFDLETAIKLARPLAALIVLSLLGSCAWGVDYSPDVTAHAASYGGMAPTFNANGRMTGLAPAVQQPRRTMFTP